MPTAPVHPMQVQRFAERQVTRYTCRICQRCVEDGPEGLTIIARGDPWASHRAGVFALEVDEVESTPASGPSGAALH